MLFLHSFGPAFIAAWFASWFSIPAAAEDLLVRKGCIDVVKDYGIGAADKRASYSLDGDPIVLTVAEHLTRYVYNEDDPIALVEEWSSAGPQVQHKTDRLSADSGEVLNCAEIVVDFRVGERSSEEEEGYSVRARSLSDITNEAKLRILLLDQVSGMREAENLYRTWEANNHRIAVRFDPIRNGETDLKSKVFSGTLAFFPGGAWGEEEHVLAIPLDEGSPYAIAPNGDPLIPRIIVLCSEACREIYDAVENADATSSSPVSEAVLREVLEPAEDSIGETRPPAIVTESPYASFTTEVAGRTSNGGLFTDGFEDIDGIACLIDAVAPDSGIFFNPPACEGDLIESIAEKQNISIRITDGGQWVFGEHVPDTPLQNITVTLPAGVNGATCQMQVAIATLEGTENLQLEYVPGSDPIAYTSLVNPAISPVDGEIVMQLLPSSGPDCGGGARRLVAAASADLSIPLVEAAPAKTAFTYLFIPDFGTNELELGAAGTITRDFSEGLIQAALSAHHRMAVMNPGAIFGIQESLGIALSQNGTEMLFKMNADQLRSSNVAARSLEREAEILSRNTFPFSQNRLVRGLMTLAGEAKRGGFQNVEVVVGGGVMQNDTIVPADPCSPTTFDTVRAGISNIDGLDLRVHLMPIVKLEGGQVPDFSAQQPLTFSANSTGQPGGLFRCAGSTDASLTIYPFYIEAWRETRDAIPRLTAAMTDQIAVLLQEYVK